MERTESQRLSVDLHILNKQTPLDGHKTLFSGVACELCREPLGCLFCQVVPHVVLGDGLVHSDADFCAQRARRVEKGKKEGSRKKPEGERREEEEAERQCGGTRRNGYRS